MNRTVFQSPEFLVQKPTDCQPWKIQTTCGEKIRKRPGWRTQALVREKGKESRYNRPIQFVSVPCKPSPGHPRVPKHARHTRSQRHVLEMAALLRPQRSTRRSEARRCSSPPVPSLINIQLKEMRGSLKRIVPGTNI